MRSIATAFGSDPEQGTARKVGTFLTLTAFQGDIVTSAMFLTAMAANPLAQKLAAQQGVTITWGGWALAALVPGLLSLLVVPLLLYKLCPPEIKTTPDATKLAQTEVARMGPIKADEWMMLGTFALLLVLWIFGPQLGGLTATAAALVGLGVLLLTGVLSWTDVQKEEGAWNTLVWFAALVMMAGFLNQLGLIPWFSATVATSLKAAGLTWTAAFAIVALVYFYSHYLFASNTAHVSAMYGAFLAVAIAVGTPPMLAALVLAFFSNLFSSMTHYGAGPAPVLFGSGFVDIGTWWRLGFVVSVVNIVIWLGVGGVWWKVLGIW
jgi:DASS family divalent anion:Na+ symporter